MNIYLSTLDWIIIVAFILLNIAISLYYANRAGKSVSEFFLSGRKLPWYVAGISMVATTFAADTPLAVTEIVNADGIAGNWLWWNFLMGGMLTVFFFANLWRRAEVLTEVEFVAIRYSGISAKILRIAKVFYQGVFMNMLIIGWVNLALVSILQVFFDLSKEDALIYTGIVMLFVALYTSLSGLWGVVINDMIQFGIAMTGCIILAYLVINSEDIGGMAALKERLPENTLNFFPSLSTISNGDNIGTSLTLGFGAIIAHLGMQWWASWYPGAEPGGGGYIAQRMMSTKNEKHAVYSTLFFQIAHYCIRPWPWIIVGLCVIVLYPELDADEKRLGYILTIRDYLPEGLKGLLLVGMLAAYMSTISTQLNWGASYVANDFYRAFINKGAGNKQLVIISRITTIILMIIGLLATMQMDSIKGVWEFVIQCGAGLGSVLIFRWYWWRINAWSELVAMTVPFLVYAILKTYTQLVFPESFFITTTLTIISWLAITFMSAPTDNSILSSFYKKIRPGGFWKTVAINNNLELEQGSKMKYQLLAWLLSIIMTYSLLFGMGKLLFQEYQQAGIWFVLGLISLFALRSILPKADLFGK